MDDTNVDTADPDGVVATARLERPSDKGGVVVDSSSDAVKEQARGKHVVHDVVDQLEL
jgi:hypothetical protein